MANFSFKELKKQALIFMGCLLAAYYLLTDPFHQSLSLLGFWVSSAYYFILWILDRREKNKK